MELSLLPKTKEGWMQLEYTMVGIVVSTLMGAMFLFGLKVGWQYGIHACP
jgi:hypothetical protein